MKSADLANNSAFNGGRHITKENLASNIWFSNTRTPTSIGVYAKTLLDAVDDSGKIQCGGDKGAQLISAALDLWLLESATVLCNSGFVRQDIGDNQSVNDCISTTDKSLKYGPSINSKQKASNALAKYLKDTVYGGVEPALTDAQKYIYYKVSLGQSCIPKIMTEKPTSGRAQSDNQYGFNDVKWVDLDADPFKIEQGYYIGSMKPGDMVITGMIYNGVNPTCQQVVNGMNSYAQAFLDWAKRNPDEAKAVQEDAQRKPGGGGSTPDDENTCGAQVTGLGWIICPLISGITKLNDGMWALVSGLLNVNPMKQSDPLYRAWGSVRSIANVLFVIFFLIIIFSQLTGMGITNYGVKKLLPKVIICAILVNISYVIIQVAVDLANIIGSSLYAFITGLAPPVDYSWYGLVTLIESGAFAAGAGVGLLAAVVAAGGTGALFWLLLPMAAMAVLGFLTAVLTLIVRQALIPILAILAPLAFVAYLLPNTEPWFKKWRGLLVSMLMLYPLAALVFAGAQFAAFTIISMGGFWNAIVGHIVLVIPLFSLPFLARQSGPILNRVNGALTGLANRARQPLTNFGRARSEAARANYLANGPAHSNSRLARITGAPRRTARNLALGRKIREDRKEADELKFKSEMNRTTGRDMNSSPHNNTNQDLSGTPPPNTPRRTFRSGGQQSLDELAMQKKHAGVSEQESVHRQDNMVEGRRLNEAANVAGLVHKTDEEHTAHRVSQSVVGQAAHQALGEAQKQSKIDTLQIEHALNTSATGQGLDLQIGHAEKQATLDTKAKVHRVETSAQGIELNQQIGEAELVEREDTAGTKYRVESDPNLLEQRLATAGAEEMLKGAQSQTAQLVTEASTEAGRTKIETALGVAPGTSQVVDTLQEAQMTKNVASSATASAQRVQQAEYTRAITADGPGGPGTPSAIAEAAAGIDVDYGVPRVQAAATAAQEKQRDENVSAVRTLYTSQQYSGDDLVRAARGEIRTSAPGAPPTYGPAGSANIEEQIAASEALVEMGREPDIAELLDRASDPAFMATPEGVLFQQNLSKQLAKSSKRPKYIPGGVLGQLATGTFTSNADALVRRTVEDRKLSMDSFRSMDIDEMTRLGRVIVTATPPIDATVRAELRDIVNDAMADPRINEKWGDREYDAMGTILVNL